MSDFDSFQQAIRLDFTELPSEGSKFEQMVQELLEAIGFNAQRSGVGPDHGVDILAEEVMLDRLGTKQVRRYVVQCKHFAHAGRAVGHAHISDVIDTIQQHLANGYLLVTSTDVTSSLKQKLQTLSALHPECSIQIWDRVTLEQRLQKYPFLITRYFPNRFRQVRFLVSEPRGTKETYVRDRILTHLHDYVGSKFIPKLYVRRYIEESIEENLNSPQARLHDLVSEYPKVVERYVSAVNGNLDVPKYLIVSSSPLVVLTWSIDFERLQKDVETAGKQLLSHRWDPASAYTQGGVQECWTTFHSFANKQRAYVRSVERLLAPLLEFAQKTDPPKEKDEAAPKKVGDQTTGKGPSRRTSRPKGKIVKGLPWLTEEFISSNGLKILNYKPPDNVKTLSFFKKWLETVRGELRNNPLAALKDQLDGVQGAIQVIVDIAGSGKTNLCCRIALQLVNKAFVVFLTGKALGREFSSIINYIEEEIRAVFQQSSDMDLRDLSQMLQRMQYPLVIVLDGVNENASPLKMRENLQELYDFVISSPVRALITSRAEYWSYYSGIFSHDSFSRITAGGLAKFTEDEHEIAIPVYLDHYKIDVRLESRAWEELKRPLILRFFCEAYGDPNRKKFRHIPPITEVRLFKLFGEYCKVKYGNICERLNADGYHVTESQVEKVSYLIAELCLSHKKRALTAKPLMKSLAKYSVHAPRVYRALLDEDIIIEETIELREKELERITSFVYEAFMEYLMARVLLFRAKNQDARLFSQCAKLLANEAEFVYIRGILAFLLPHCVGTFPKTWELILSQLRRPDYAENCVPVLVNLWDSDWETGIWPVLKAAAGHLLLVPLEQTATFVSEWVAEHHVRGFLRSIQEDPRALISILDTHLIQIMETLKVDRREEIIEPLLSLLDHAKTPVFAQEVLNKIRGMPWLSNDTISRGEHLFGRIVRSSLPILDEIGRIDRVDRDWTVLDLLAKLGEQWGVDQTQILRTEALLGAAQDALFDWYCYTDNINYQRLWWAEMLELNVGEIESEAKRWTLDPSLTPAEQYL